VTTILHVSDLHYERPPERRSPGITERLGRALGSLRAHPFDVLVVSGDLTSYGTWDRRELEGVRALLERLGTATLVVPGNHDLGANRERGERYPVFEHYEAVAWQSTNFARVFGQGPVVALRRGDVTILGVALREGDTDGALGELERELASATTPVVVVGHYPLEPVRDRGILARFGAEGYVGQEMARLRELLVHSPRVVAYLSGHVHAADARIVDGVLALSAGALGPGPVVGWLLQVGRSHLRFEQVQADGPTTFWASELLEGADPELYHLGEIRRGDVVIEQRVATT